MIWLFIAFVNNQWTSACDFPVTDFFGAWVRVDLYLGLARHLLNSSCSFCFRPPAACVRARFWKWASSRLAFPVWPSSAAAPNDCGRWQRRVIIMDRAHLMAVGGCVRGGAWNSPQPPVSPPHLFRVLERTKDLHLLWCQKAHPIGEEWFQSANSNKLTSGKSARHFDANTFSWRIRRYHFFLVLCGVIWYEKFFYSITTALKSINY